MTAAATGQACNESILLVEDNEQVRSLLTTVLQDTGYQVETAENGALALDLYKKEESHFDLVVSDVVMPVMNGMELYRQLQQTNPEARVILIVRAYRPDGIGGRVGSETGQSAQQTLSHGQVYRHHQGSPWTVRKSD